MQRPRSQYETEHFPTWCPGCGDFAIWKAIRESLTTQKIAPHEVAAVYDIGCSGNMADKLRAYGLHGLHGRALPVAEGIKVGNHQLPVIVIAGDGGSYGEGLQHMLHSARANHDVTFIVHNNAIYGLTKGQTSPMSEQGYTSSSTPEGNPSIPIRPLALALEDGATFVARGFSANVNQLSDLIAQAMQHRGFALVDVLQPCVTFNHINTYQWFKDHAYDIPDSHNAADRNQALALIHDPKRLPLGILYKDENRPSFHEMFPQIAGKPLVQMPVDDATMEDIYKDYL